MRGTKGGFFDRLMERLRFFIRKFKKKKKKEEKELLKEKQKQKIIKENEQIKLSVYTRQKKEQEKLTNKPIKVSKSVLIDKEVKNKIRNDIKNNEKQPQIYIDKKKEKKNNNKKVINSRNIDNIKKSKDNEKIIIKNKTNEENKNDNDINNKINKEDKKNTNNTNINKDNNKEFINRNIAVITPYINDNNQSIIKEIKKIIEKDRKDLEKLISELKKLDDSAKKERDLEKLNKIEQRVIGIERRINRILYNYELLKSRLSEDILSKLENEKLYSIIGDPKNLTDNQIENIIENYETKLDYYEEIITAINLKDTTKNDISNRKVVVAEHKNEFDEEKRELDYIVENSKNLIEEFKNEEKKLKDISEKIDNININKTVIKISATSRLLNRTGNFIKGVLGLPLIATFNPALIAVGSYLIGSSIGNLRKNVNNKVKEKIYYEPDMTYIEELKNRQYTMDDLLRMLNNNISDIRYFKQEYILNFGSYHNYSEYNKNLSVIEDIEKKLLNQQKIIEKQKEKIRQVEQKQNKKLIYIKEMNQKSSTENKN